MSTKNDGHYFCGAGGNRPDGLNETLTFEVGAIFCFINPGGRIPQVTFLLILPVVKMVKVMR
ncbi:hypothetical protein E2R62_01695 [Citrobacter rodentium]|uniref:Copper resistance protein n=1 Tax=Citrobacter rodentium TaxID=67825 RepID=A0A482PDG4_CITRO|nr:hypothetical protein E2R62_01695 [Citrobacter rodentium]